ncbi:hypothetical protein CS8_096760 [Cupriavidus sp. 8B]
MGPSTASVVVPSHGPFEHAQKSLSRAQGSAFCSDSVDAFDLIAAGEGLSLGSLPLALKTREDAELAECLCPKMHTAGPDDFRTCPSQKQVMVSPVSAGTG